jgi:RNA polymerase sigma factor (sigma-70 family)
MLWEDITRDGATAAKSMTQRDRLLDHIRRLALQGMGERRTDGQLLELFISARDEAAFALLLRRHGAMVWSVCRRVLGNAHDADDAFQATFLVFVRKADSIRPREAVGNWLYGVAYRTALESRGRIARRRAKERPLQDVPSPENKPQEQCQELWPIFDRELSRLADKYRLPIVLCDLEGRSRKEVARQLAIPEGTLSSRLATARKKLAARLARYGFAVTAASLGTLLTEKAATASLSLSLLSATTKAALLAAAGSTAVAGAVSATVSTLTEGVLKAMFIAKIKTATLVLCSVASLGVGTGGVYYQTRAGAADSPQTDRVVQDNRKSISEPRDREIDKLRRENQQLREMLKREGERKAAYREKLNTFVKNWTPTIQASLAAQWDQPHPKPEPNPNLEDLKAARQQVITEYNRRIEALREQM